MSAIHALVAGDRPPNVYRLSRRASVEGLVTAATEAGWRVVVVSGREAPTKASFLTTVASAFRLPAWFGRNWDALEDCLTDEAIVGERTTLLVLDHLDGFAAADAEQWEIGLDVLAGVVDHWTATETPWFVVVAGTVGVHELAHL